MRVRFWVALTVVLLSGATVGFFGGKIWVMHQMRAFIQSGPEEHREMIVGRLQRRLGLDGRQREKAMEAIGCAAQEMDKIRHESRERSTARLKVALDEIRPLLSVEQQRELERIDLRELRSVFYSQKM